MIKGSTKGNNYSYDTHTHTHVVGEIFLCSNQTKGYLQV